MPNRSTISCISSTTSTAVLARQDDPDTDLSQKEHRKGHPLDVIIVPIRFLEAKRYR